MTAIPASDVSPEHICKDVPQILMPDCNYHVMQLERYRRQFSTVFNAVVGWLACEEVDALRWSYYSRLDIPITGSDRKGVGAPERQAAVLAHIIASRAIPSASLARDIYMDGNMPPSTRRELFALEEFRKRMLSNYWNTIFDAAARVGKSPEDSDLRELEIMKIRLAAIPFGLRMQYKPLYRHDQQP